MMIYCVEDDSSIRELIVYTLEISGFEALGFVESNSFFESLNKQKPDLIMLDIMLEGKSGLDILKELKANSLYKDIPVIMATAKTSEFDKVTGLDAGADDYLAKPFGMLEMVSRVRAVLRRSTKNDSLDTINYKNLSVDKLKHKVSIDNQIIDLTPKEYDLLLIFLENPGIVFSRDQLLEKIWGSDYLGESRTIDVHIGTLRNKLKELGNCISTMHGVGYFLKENNG